jgi:hypothetical protein
MALLRPRTRRHEPAPEGLPDDLEVAVDPGVHTEVFLGTLRSEVDDPDELAQPFQLVAMVTEGVLSAYRRRDLTAEEAAQRLAVLRLRTAAGIEWTLGATSLRWYRRLPGGRWVIAVPPREPDGVLIRSVDEALAALDALDGAGSAPAGPAPAVAPARQAAPAPTVPQVPTPDVDAGEAHIPGRPPANAQPDLEPPATVVDPLAPPAPQPGHQPHHAAPAPAPAAPSFLAAPDPVDVAVATGGYGDLDDDLPVAVTHAPAVPLTAFTPAQPQTRPEQATPAPVAAAPAGPVDPEDVEISALVAELAGRIGVPLPGQKQD